jgi:hypothetical protein
MQDLAMQDDAGAAHRPTRRGLRAPQCGRALMRPCPDAAVTDRCFKMPVKACTEPGIGEEKADIPA